MAAMCGRLSMHALKQWQCYLHSGPGGWLRGKELAEDMQQPPLKKPCLPGCLKTSACLVPQATALALRPKLTSGLRRPWNIYHWWQGRAAILLGVANVY